MEFSNSQTNRKKCEVRRTPNKAKINKKESEIAQNKYKTKLKHLKRLIRQVVFENAALCDECVSVSDKLNKVRFRFNGQYVKKV